MLTATEFTERASFKYGTNWHSFLLLIVKKMRNWYLQIDTKILFLKKEKLFLNLQPQLLVPGSKIGVKHHFVDLSKFQFLS